MKKQAVGCFLVLSCAMLVAAGCAKQQVVKKDESLAPAAPAAKPVQKSEPVKAQSVKQSVVKESPVQETKPATQDQLKAALDKVYFDFDSFKLHDTARQTLQKNAEFMKKNAGAKVRIEGNCDERGSDEYNLALGEKRAKSAMQYLVSLGIPAERLSVISYGKEKPADPGHNEAAWAKNRRDEFVVQ